MIYDMIAAALVCKTVPPGHHMPELVRNGVWVAEYILRGVNRWHGFALALVLFVNSSLHRRHARRGEAVHDHRTARPPGRHCTTVLGSARRNSLDASGVISVRLDPKQFQAAKAFQVRKTRVRDVIAAQIDIAKPWEGR